MKKLISLLVVISIFVVACIPTTMAFFMMPTMEISNSISNETISSSECCDTMLSSCTERTHECCFSSIVDTANFRINLPQKEDKILQIKKYDTNFLAFLQETSEYNYIEKLTAPPEGYNGNNDDNNYITLTGIIKSNC